MTTQLPHSDPLLTGPPASRTGLWLHRAQRGDSLVAGLAELLSDPLPDPFATEVVCVPTHGMERWLSQSLSMRLGAGPLGGDGVCAGIRFARLDTVLRETVSAVLHIDPADDPWQPGRGVWSLLTVIDDCLDETWLEPLRRHVDPTFPGARRYATAARVFGLFAAYAAQRPSMLARWRTGDAVDPRGEPLGHYAAWQAHLWLRLRARLTGPDPAERTPIAIDALTADPASTELPERLSVFGPTRLSGDQVSLLKGLALGREIRLWLPHCSPALWDATAALARGVPRGSRSQDPTAAAPRHRLNQRLARDARELQVLLSETADGDRSEDPPTVPATTLLGRLQAAVLADEPTPSKAPLLPDDDSIRFHACHGPDRQVEVLREVVLGLLSDHPELEPRDLVVMCPDIETFAPLISAAFALDGLPEGARHPGQLLTVRLADRSLRQLNPLLGTLARLLELGESRAGLSELLDLCADPPVARRFGFGEKELERLRELVVSSGIRWGIDAGHRGRWRMDGFGQNTWSAGLDRMLLGIALSEDGGHYRGTAYPLDDVDSSDVDLIGRFTELASRLRRIADSFATPQTLPAWMAACRRALESVAEVPATEHWQISHAWSVLADLNETAPGTPHPQQTAADPAAPNPEPAPGTLTLSPRDVRTLLADAFAGRPSRANFRTGALTLCTMTPMRTVPHQAVILLGLDDGVFPRRVHPDGDDLLAADPWVGDRDARSEDRQVLLDAVLAATRHLVVIRSGASPQTGQPRPMAAPIAELRDAIVDLCDDTEVWERIEVRHPLQPYATANFTGPTPFSFDDQALRAAEAAARGPRRPEPIGEFPTLPPLPEFESDPVEVELADLIRFFQHPARDLLRRRAGIYVGGGSDRETLDEIPVELDGLDAWSIGDRMLAGCLRGIPMEQLREIELRRGTLPPRAQGAVALQTIENRVAAIGRAANRWLDIPASGTWIRARLGRWALSGMVSGIRDRTLLQVSYSSLRGKSRLEAWIQLLALKVSHPETDWRAVTIGRSGHGRILGPVATADASARLNELLTLYARGSRELIRLPPNTAADQADITLRGAPPRGLPGTWRFEHDDAWARCGVGEFLTDLTAFPAGSADGGRQSSQFEALTMRVWGPLLDAEGSL